MPQSCFVARALAICLAAVLAAATAFAQQAPTKPFEPTVGQAGKDVVWVPTPPELVEKMLDMARVSSADVVMDLGSGDGRNVIAAARRGARAIGVEFNPDMVALSERRAQEAGVAGKATFVQGDMYQADISSATVMALFLLPDNLRKLTDKFLALKPGTRLVMNTFGIPDWDADVTETVGGTCPSWCTSLLYIVPANVAGTWKLAQGDLTLTQTFQKISGTLSTASSSWAIADGKLSGDQITFTVDGAEYAGRVTGDRMEGTAARAGKKENWTSTRVR